MAERFLVVGLGNPGKKYQMTRHNLGFMVVDRIAEILGLTFQAGSGEYLFARGAYQSNEVILSKPLTYVNLSGLAVKELVDLFTIALQNLLVIHDDVNLPFGKLRLRGKGSDGGHRGLASVIYHLHTEHFPRLRIGIGTEAQKEQLVHYVLSPFTKEEQQLLGDVIEKACQTVLSFMEVGILETMNRFN